MVGKFSTSSSPTSSAWSSMSIQRNSTPGNFSPSARKPGRYSTQVSHHSAQRQLTTTMPDFMHAVLGMAGLVALAWLASEARRAVPWRAVAAGIVLELALALGFLKLAAGKNAFMAADEPVLRLGEAAPGGARPGVCCFCGG